MNTDSHSQTAAFIWSVADLLRGDFKQSQYGRVILPFTLLRRLECVLAPTKAAVLAGAQEHQNKPEAVRDKLLLRAAEQQFFNASPLTLGTLSDTQTADDLMSYLQAFSQDAREIFDHFHFEDFVQQLAANDLLYQVVQRVASIDLSPERISNYGMGVIFEELIRKFAESSNETAGAHYTPRDIVNLTTSLVLTRQDEALRSHRIATVYDPTAGTGGFLSKSDEYIQQVREQVTVSLHGQELNPESYAICKAHMLIKGQDVGQIKLGNTLSDDQLPAERFDFMLANPPFGVEWKNVQKQVTDEHKQKGYNGRFGPGLPRVSDGSLLFLLHLVSKMRSPKDGGSRIGIILNRSTLFTGEAGSGESEIRRYLLQHDLVEAIVALPTDMFYNTGIATYVWVLSNCKPAERRGKVQLINASERYTILRKSLGNKRRYMTDRDIDEIVRCYGAFEETEQSKVIPLETFGYRRITVERPLRLNFQATPERLARLDDVKGFQKLDEADRNALIAACATLDAKHCYKNKVDFIKDIKPALERYGVGVSGSVFKYLLKALSERDPEAEIESDELGHPTPDLALREFVNLPLGEEPDEEAVKINQDIPDGWLDQSKVDPVDEKVGVVGYKINFATFFLGGAIKPIATGLNAELLKISCFSRIVTDENDDWDVAVSCLSGTSIPSEKVLDYHQRKLALLLKIDSSVVMKDYLESILDSSIWKSGVLKEIQRFGYKVIDFDTLMSIEIPTPDLETQAGLVSFINETDEQVERMRAAREEVWLAPHIRHFSNKSQGINDQFMEVLPYPLSNLLHHQDNTSYDQDKERYELILKFLECAAQYCCAVLISIMKDLNVDIGSAVKKKERTFQRKGSSFGFWVHFIKEMKDASESHKEISSDSSLFPWGDFLDKDGALFGALPALEKARDIRNDKLGHGVYPTPQEAAATLEEAEKLLEEFSKLAMPFFSQTELIRPGMCKWDGFSYQYEVEKFSGLYAYPFLRDKINSRMPLRYGRLHVLLKDYERIIELPELLVMSPAVKNDSFEGFFFLGRCESEGYLYLCHQQLPMQWRTEKNKGSPFLIV